VADSHTCVLSRTQTAGSRLTNVSSNKRVLPQPSINIKPRSQGRRSADVFTSHWVPRCHPMGAPRSGRACISRVSRCLYLSGSHLERGCTIAVEPEPCIVRVCCVHFHSQNRHDGPLLPRHTIVRHGRLIEILLRQRWRRCNGRLLGCCSRSVAPAVKMTA